MPTNTSPNMGMPVPVVGQESGPQYATDINNSLTIIDNHNHAAGAGVQINPAGININSDLTFNSNNATSLNSARFTALGAPLAGSSPNLDCIYVSGVDLYYNDGNGNQVRITQSGGVAGSPGSISNLTSPASASYQSGPGTFVWQSAANTAANMDMASITIRDQTANSNGITINVPPALAANYSMNLPPTLPGTAEVLTLDNSGNIGYQTYDQVGQNMSSVGANAVAASRTRTVAQVVGIGGVATSPSCGVFNVPNGSTAMVTNMSVTITTSGRPVMLMLVPTTNVGGNGFITATGTMVFQFFNTSNSVSFFTNGGPQSSVVTGQIPSGSICMIDTFISGSPGTYNYQLYASVANSGTIANCQLIAYEL